MLRRPIDQAALADRAVIPPEQQAWFTSRADAPEVPSTTPAREAADAIVILVTIDSLRADFVAKASEQVAPALTAMRDGGVDFTHARAAGSQTACSITALFMGKYFSQQRWGDIDSGGRTWPTPDKSPRFPALLTAHGVKTVLFDVLPSYHGLVEGFSEVVPFMRSHRAISASEIANGVVKRLGQKPAGPVFMYGHVMDVHSPYGLGRGTPRDRYRQQISSVDKQIERIRQAIEDNGLAARTTLIVSADHGEAFGEHGMTFHGQSVFDELLRVPLLVEHPSFPPQRVDAAVSLIDVGPTVLDLFGVATPGTFMGQSLAPVLRGEPAHFTRPIVAENHLLQAMIFPDDVKVIRDLRFGAHRAFDLRRDPGELVDRIADARLDPTGRLALMGAFFRAHALGGDYVTPYRR
jgi:arylsulfatase A-like enzyme